jgi:hypothetical protein
MYQINYFVNVMVIQSSVLKIILRFKTFLLCTPTLNGPTFTTSEILLHHATPSIDEDHDNDQYSLSPSQLYYI